MQVFRFLFYFLSAMLFTLYSSAQNEPSDKIRAGDKKAESLAGIPADQTSLQSALSVYPNPAEDKLFIKNSAGRSVKCEIEIFDITGILVFKKSLSKDEDFLDVSFLADGMYMFKIKYGATVLTKRIYKK